MNTDWAPAAPSCLSQAQGEHACSPAQGDLHGASESVAADFDSFNLPKSSTPDLRWRRSALCPEHVESKMADKKERPQKVVADNRKARFNYEIGEVVEAGIALTGTEVKSLRTGRATIAESYADAKNGEIWLINANIPEYLKASHFNHAPKRPRKLLLHKRQIHKLAIAVEREGMTIVPLRLFFNEKGRAKIDIALGRGKKLHDKRETEKKRSWEREKGRLMRLKG
jgi:SsrA-binding protein